MKILFTGCHFFSCSEQLPRQLPLFFLWKSRFKSFKALRVFVSAGDTVQKSGRQLADQEIIRFRVVGIPHALGFGRNKAGLAVKQDIAGDGKCSCAHFLRFFHGIVQQFLSVALPLVCGRNSDWTEGHDRHLSSVIAVDFRPHIDTFGGWYDENGAQYTEDTVYAIAGDATLTARWTANICEITLDANGGKVEPSALAVVYGQAVGALPVHTREGYVFLGWFDEAGSRYDASSVYSVKGDTTLTARWIENSVQTGDGFPIFLLSGAMMAAAAGAVMLLLKRRKLMGE